MRSKMTSPELHCLFYLLLVICWSSVVEALCSLDQLTTTVQCRDLEDVKYIEVYHLNKLRAPSSSKVLAIGNFENFTSLKHLDLSGGRIETIRSRSFSKLTSLQTLNLENNRLHLLEADAFDGLKNLHSLNLRNNDIRQLSSALMTLKNLQVLDLAGNPLNCNCASLKMRDALIHRGVKISKETVCSEPSSAKDKRISKPDTVRTCEFEIQDLEMQGDQAEDTKVEEPAEDDKAKGAEEEVKKDATATEPPVAHKEEEIEAATGAPETKVETAEVAPASTEAVPIEAISTEASSTSTTESVHEVSVDVSEDSKKESTPSSVDSVLNASEPDESEDADKSAQIVDLIRTDAVKKLDSSSDSSTERSSEKSNSPAVLEEGSGEAAVDDGSGSEGSGTVPEVPGIDFSHVSRVEEETGLAKTTTEGSPSFWGFGAVINNWLPFGSSPTTTQAPTPTEKSLPDVLKEDEFMSVTKNPPVEEAVPPKIDTRSGDSTSPNEGVGETKDGGTSSDSVDSASTQESKQGMASYIVLAILLAILGTLIITAAYKGDFCRRKTKRRDVERGTELKDMQKSLLDPNASQPKIRPSNGNTLENVPLMHGSAPPGEPQSNQRSYDITPSVITNGSSRLNGAGNDRAKPSRKSPSQELAPPLNGLNPPMDAIDGPTTMDDESNEILHNGDYDGKYSPNAQRVKITMQDIPDSLPKTPILITRLRDGENLVKTP